MPKPWRLTRQAERALVEIAGWTLETCGPRQVEVCAADLIARCAAIAAGEAPSPDCRRLMDPDLAEALRFSRAGRHFVVFVEMADQVVIVDVLPSRSDLPRRLAPGLCRGGDPPRGAASKTPWGPRLN